MIEELRQEDFERRGGFLDGAYVTQLSLKPDDPWVEYYRNEPTKYPESQSIEYWALSVYGGILCAIIWI